MKSLSLSAVALLVFTACGDGRDTNEPDPIAPPEPYYGEVARSDLLRDTDPDVSAGQMDELVAGNTGFAFRLYQYLADEPGNLFFSPHSISTALAMTYAGARVRTANEMADTLGYTLPQAELHPAFNALDLALMSRGENAEARDGEAFRLNIGNAVWSKVGLPLLMEFLDVLAESYDAGVRLVDFSDPAAAADIINAWVSAMTEERIPELLMAGDLDGAELVLTNTIYFNARWMEVFPEEFTESGDFHLLDGGVADASFMVHSFDTRYAEGDGYQAVELPYDGEELSMVVLVPDSGRFDEVESNLYGGFVTTVVDALDSAHVAVTLPKWEHRFKADLTEALSDLGMPIAFTGMADFSGITGSPELFISKVIHQAFVAVDEYGTEAAAATAVVLVRGYPDATVVADRPFIYFIRDIETGAILFIGRVVDPAA